MEELTMHFFIVKEERNSEREEKEKKLALVSKPAISDSYVGCVARNKVSSLFHLFAKIV